MNFANGRYEPGNHATYALKDGQITRTSPEHPERGLYVGVSAMTAASHFNAYDRYYGARLYKLAPFAVRPQDVAPLVSTCTGFSKRLTDSLVANGTSVWRNSASLTASYNFHLAVEHPDRLSRLELSVFNLQFCEGHLGPLRGAGGNSSVAAP